MSSFQYLQKELAALQHSSRLRKLHTIRNGSDALLTSQNSQRQTVNFSSNNYLSIADHPAIKHAVTSAAEQFGYGSGGSRLISGSSNMHSQVESAFANLLNKEASLLFSSGWTANQALLQAIPQKGDLLLLDKLDHASIIDGCMAANAEFRTYRRGNLARLEKLLAESSHKRKFIITESIFSMDGDSANLPALIELKKKYGAYLIVDEAHALGCMGPHGAGMAAELGLLNDIDIVVAPLGKAVAANGAVIAGPRIVIDYLINNARSFIYTTSCSQVNCAAILAALNVIKTEPHRKAHLKNLADYARSKLSDAGFDTGASTSHIIPVMMGPDDLAVKAADWLMQQGFFIVAIRPPTVPKGSARLRISLQHAHTRAQIDALANALHNFRTQNT